MSWDLRQLEPSAHLKVSDLDLEGADPILERGEGDLLFRGHGGTRAGRHHRGKRLSARFEAEVPTFSEHPALPAQRGFGITATAVSRANNEGWKGPSRHHRGKRVSARFEAEVPRPGVCVTVSGLSPDAGLVRTSAVSRADCEGWKGWPASLG